MIKRMWIDQPSTLQPLHELHGTPVLASLVSGEVCATIYLLEGDTISMMVPILCLSDGWNGGHKLVLA